MRTFLAAALLATAPAAIAQERVAPVTVIHAGHLLAVPGRPALGPSTIVIRGNRIESVSEGFRDGPAGARLIELRDQWVMPGLIDSHIHMGSSGEQLKDRIEGTTANREDAFVKGIRNAGLDLQAGFTTVRELGGYPPMSRALKRGIAEGVIEGPTIVMAARMVSVTGGHGDPRNGLRQEFAHVAEEDMTAVCDGPDDCRRATRKQIADGAEVIKFAATGGVGSNVAGGLGRQMTPEEMKAVVDTAHLWGRKVASHAHGLDGINAALEAGVDSIEHGTYGDSTSFALYKRTGAYYVPTLLAPQEINKAGQRGELTPASAAKAREVAGLAIKTLSAAYKSGVRIAFGTDTGVGRHGINGQEFALMTEAGIPPAVTLRMATIDAATLLGRADRIGTIEAGKDADIIAVDEDPVANIRTMERVSFVMRQGRVHKSGGQHVVPDAAIY
ncbi:MAG: amidohydrolase family protein [Sphingomonadaceae bacterium]|nr:amidohydrolase family protein [Sphingomonadaceae bacterium]